MEIIGGRKFQRGWSEMAFSELIKNFDRLRDYMRDFFIYGYKTRSGFSGKSPRTYDNERRRIESYLGDHIRWEYGKGGKRVFLSMDAAKIPRNPLYRAYQSKSFTDNDILLHFFLLDLLEDAPPMTAGQASDEISLRYGEFFDAQTVRGKLREYADAGLLRAEKQGKAVLYRKSDVTFQTLFPNPEDARDFLAFFGECAPFSVVGSYLADRARLDNTRLLFKHHFLVHTLEDTILLPLVQAMRERRLVEIANFSGKSGVQTVASGLPIAILVSVQTGRRYLMLYGNKRRRFHSFRLDYLKSVKLLDICGNADALIQEGLACLGRTWGASLSPSRKTERFAMTLAIDEETEPYVLDRLRREGRGGTVRRLGQNRFRFSVEVTDSCELMGWVKTFTGRILSVEGDSPAVVSRFYRDMERMAALYREEAP